MSKSDELTVKYLINLLNNNTVIKIIRHKYLIDSYPTLKINSLISYYNLLVTLLIAYKNTNYTIDNTTLEISLDVSILIEYFKNIEEFIKNSSIDQNRKKKYINYIHSQINQSTSTYPTNDSILILCYYFGINLIIYNNETQTIKFFYYDNQVNVKLPFILIKETKNNQTSNLYYELIFSQNKFIFENNHPLIIELIPNAFVIGFEQNKKLEYLELNNIADILEQIKDPIIKYKLKTIPTKYNQLIKEFQNLNIEYIKYIK
jgi:hypothetical protein